MLASYVASYIDVKTKVTKAMGDLLITYPRISWLIRYATLPPNQQFMYNFVQQPAVEACTPINSNTNQQIVCDSRHNYLQRQSVTVRSVSGQYYI